MFSKVKETIKSHSRIFMAAALAVTLVVAGVSFKVEKPQYHGETTLTSNVGVVLTIGSGVEASSTADYTCTGVNDHLQLQAALNALPAVGGKLVILAGNYVFGGTVSRAINNVTIEGMGTSTYFANNGAAALFSVGAQTGWVIRDIKTDAGGITNATNATLDNVTLGATYYAHSIPSGTYTGNVSATTVGATTLNAPTGRTATYVIAASDAPAIVKAQADKTCDGTADDVQIQEALTAGYLNIWLSQGTFNISTTLRYQNHYQNLIGSGRTATVLYLSSGSDCTVIAGNGATTLTQCGIGSLLIDGNKTNNASGNGVDFTGLTSYHIKDVVISNCKQHGISTDGSYGANTSLSIDRVFITACTLMGVNANPAYGVVVNNLYTMLNGYNGFSLSGGESFITNYVSDRDCAAPPHAYIGSITLSGTSDMFLSNVYIDGGTSAESQTFYKLQVASSVRVMVNNLEVRSGTMVDQAFAISVDGSNDVQISNFNIYDVQNTAGRQGLKVTNSTRNTFSNGSIRVNGNANGLGISEEGTSTGNTFSQIDLTQCSVPISKVATSTSAYCNNPGYIAPSEIRTASGSLTAGNANAITFAWHDPELQDILIRKVTLEITTPGGTALSVIQVGIADDATGTNLGAEFFTAIDANAAAVLDSFLATDTGAQTKWVFCQDSASATDGWIVGQILTQNAAALAGKYYVEYCGR